MRFRAESFVPEPLLPVYLFFGEEPLLLQEAADRLREEARRQGFGERVVWTVEGGFDWSRLWEAASPSLFSPRTLIELRLGKIGEGGKAIRAYAEAPSPDALLVLHAGRLDASQQKSAWFQAVERAGAVVHAPALEASRLPGWIRERAAAKGLALTPEAVELLAARVEGNLLAASWEIEKLALLYQGAIDEEKVMMAVADSARFTVYHLADAALLGEKGKAARVLQRLREEGVEPPLVLWALVREIRTLASLAFALERGEPEGKAMARLRIWERRRPLMKGALRRHASASLQGLLVEAAAIDRAIKGGADDPWQGLLQLALKLAGREDLWKERP